VTNPDEYQAVPTHQGWARQGAMVLTALVFVVAADLSGQQARAAWIDRLEPGQVVRVRPNSGPRIASRLLSVRGDSLVLSVADSTRSLSPGAIDSLWVGGHATLIGALIGTGIGAAGSLAVAAAVCQSIDEDFPCGDSPQAIAASMAGGAVVGAFIGSLVRKWHLRYARNSALGARISAHPQPSLRLSVSLP